MGWRERDLGLAQAVYARHPDWLTHAIPQEWVLVRLSAPDVPPLELRLDGLTLVWGDWHTEYERFPGDDDALQLAVQTIEDVLAERLVLALGYRANDRLGAVRLLSPGAPPEDPAAPSGRIACAEAAGPFVRWELRSWRGTYTAILIP